MKNIKIVLIVLSFIFLVGVVAQANELNASVQPKLNFVSKSIANVGDLTPIQSRITNYKWSHDQKVNFWKNIWIAGAITTGVSFLVWLTGAILIGVYFGYSYGTLTGVALSYASWLGLYWAGCALLGVGMTFFWIGIAALVVGLVFWNLYKNNKLSMLSEIDYNSCSLKNGISIRF